LKPDNEFLAVGRHRLANRAFLAPMAGITDLPFRRMATRFGAGLVVSEMIASEWLAEGDPAAQMRVEGEGVGLHVAQLAGCEARWLSEGARIAESAGAHIIDINMGCPARHVTGGQSGSALMRDLDHALSLIEATIAAVEVPVTLKMRLGWDDRTRNAPELARRAEAAGVKLITVHGRTRCQFYKGEADWDAVRGVRDATSVPLVVNGDVRDEADVQAALAFSGADAVMVGRAAEGRPWLPGVLARFLATGRREPEPSLAHQGELIAALYQDMLGHHGREIGLRHARKHLGWALTVAAQTARAPLELLKRARPQILTSTEPAAVLRHLAEVYDAFSLRLAA